MQVLLIRHCASTGQAPDAALSEAGERQAFDLAHELAGLGIDALVSSPYERARATIRPLAIKLELPVALDERLRERVLSAQPLDDWMDHLRRSFAEPDYAAPGGESMAQAAKRGLAALADAAGTGAALPALVSHGNLIAAILKAADSAFGFEHWRAMRNPDIFRVTTRNGAPLGYERLAPPHLQPEGGKTP